jgi:hypothetical protein
MLSPLFVVGLCIMEEKERVFGGVLTEEGMW